MPKKSGKDKGSITQKADSQKVRISQVSNVSAAVTEMGRKTTNEIQETDRKIASGGDSREIAGSMNSVLKSLQNTVDSLGRGVEAATLGTVKATKDAISQYGQAISEDFKVNRQNMVASALAQSTPIFGYFASKFMETGVFKKTKDKLTEGISGIFKRKSKGGVMPDDFGNGGGGSDGIPKSLKPIVAPIRENQQIIAKELPKLREGMVKDKASMLSKFKQANEIKQKEFEEPAEDRMLKSLSAIQGAVGASVGKWQQIYNKMLIEHPVFRGMIMTGRVLKNTFGLAWKAGYFIFKPRGGYRRYLSKSKQPLDAINANIGQLFMQQIPRLDAIMIYTKGTAIAMRDLAAHVTGKKYPMMDPSKLGGTWSIGGTAMKGLRALGRGVMGAAKWGIGKTTKKGSKTQKILSGSVNTLGLLGSIYDMLLTGPGRLRSKLKSRSAGAKEQRRLFGGLEETTGRKRRDIKPRKPKGIRGMGIRHTPTFYVQGVYDEYYIGKEKKKKKEEQKLLGWTKDIAKGMDQHNRREKRRSVWKFLGAIGSGIMSTIGFVLKTAMRFLTNPYVIIGGIIATVGAMIVKWFHTNITPSIQAWVDREMKKGGEEFGKHIRTAEEAKASAKAGDIKAILHMKTTAQVAGALKDTDLPLMMQNHAQSFKAGQMEVYSENLDVYADFTQEELSAYRQIYKKKEKKWQSFTSTYNWMFSPGVGTYSEMTMEGVKAQGREYEEGFIKFLKGEKKDLRDPVALLSRRNKLIREFGQERVDELFSQGMKFGEVEAKLVNERGKKKLEASKNAANSLTSVLDSGKAREWAEKHGGHYMDYIGLKISDARTVAQRFGATFKDKVEAVATITQAKAEELAKKYPGSKAEDFVNKTVDKAHALGKSLAEKATGVATTVKDKAAEITEEHGPKAKGWFGRQWESMKKWGGTTKPTMIGAATDAASNVKQSGTGDLGADVWLYKAGLTDSSGNVLTGEALANELSTWSVAARSRIFPEGMQVNMETLIGKYRENLAPQQNKSKRVVRNGKPMQKLV